MEKSGGGRRLGMLALSFLGVWLVMRYLFPVALPFGLGWLFARISEPGVRFAQRRLRLPRSVASAAVITLGLAGLAVLVWLLGAVAYREMGVLLREAPGFVEELTGRVAGIQVWALGLVGKAPEGLAEPLERTVRELFTGGSVLIEKVTDSVLGVAGSLVGGLPGGALLIGTAVLSSYMISAQMPAIRSRLAASEFWNKRVKPMAGKLKEAVGLWLKAQLKLSSVTFGIVLAGLVLLRVRHAVLWALLTAAVDAVPMLGTGVVMVPWAIVSFLRGQTVQGVGLLGVFVTAMMTRSALEPKLVGRHLGLNPLLTLFSLYAGYRIWGVAGMILSPILAVTANQLASLGAGDLQ